MSSSSGTTPVRAETNTSSLAGSSTWGEDHNDDESGGTKTIRDGPRRWHGPDFNTEIGWLLRRRQQEATSGMDRASGTALIRRQEIDGAHQWCGSNRIWRKVVAEGPCRWHGCKENYREAAVESSQIERAAGGAVGWSRGYPQ